MYPHSDERTGDVLVWPSMPPSDAMKPNPLSVEALRANFTWESGKRNQMCIRSERYFRKLVMNTERKWNTGSCFVTSDVWNLQRWKKQLGLALGPRPQSAWGKGRSPPNAKPLPSPKAEKSWAAYTMCCEILLYGQGSLRIHQNRIFWHFPVH